MSSTPSIGKYRLLERIGQGAMGEVFRAHDPVLDRQVALKIITGADDDRRQRFHREAQSAARLAHPNIVVVHDFGEDSGRFYMAMELLEGRDLKAIIAMNAISELDGRLRVMEQVCDAVAFAHSQHIVHRDLKPANIFLLPNGRVKILDFGLARLSHSDMTGTGAILGTPNYMAPEQIRAQKVDARADIFALGTVFYELLSGRRAFVAESLPAVMYKVLQYDPEPLRVVAPSIPVAVSDLVRKAMAKDPSLRFQSLLGMRDAIRAVGSQTAVPGHMSLNAVMRELTTDTLMVNGRGERRAGGGEREGEFAQYRVPASKPPGPTSMTGVWPSTPTPSPSTPTSAPASMPAGPMLLTFSHETGGEVVIEGAPGQTLLEASLAAGIPHTHECGGNARCSTCRVLVLSGGENLSPRDSAELKLAKRLGFGEDIRLACQTKVRGPVRVRRLIRDAEDVRLVRVDSAAETQGMEMPLAVLYAGVRETASLLRRNLPYDVIHIVNRFHLQVGEAVLANGGHIDNYAAGSLIALFGISGEDARTKCTNAIRAALRMQKRMETLNRYLHENFGLTFTLDVGLHYGRMIVGRIGHPDHTRLTAIGDASSIAMSVGAANQFHASNILATEALVNVIEGDVHFGQVSHERVGGEGSGSDTTLYEVLDFAKPDTHYLVQTTFERIAERKDEAAAMFYRHLFEIAPATRAMFAHVDMNVQGAMLMNMLAAAVKGLDRLDELKPVLIELGRRHAAYGTRLDHFAAVEECLLYTVEQMLGKDFNLDVKLAWTQIYNFVAGTMMEAMLDA